MDGFFNHKATMLINKGSNKIYLAPGVINEICIFNPSYSYNGQNKEIKKNMFSCVLNYDFNNGNSIFQELSSGFIYTGSKSETILSKENSFDENIYISSLCLINTSYYKDLIDKITQQ